MGETVERVLIERGKQYDELNAKIRQLESRISELESACVMGGDGKPIVIGKTIHFWSVFWKRSCHCLTESISKDEKGYYINNYPRRLYAQDCFSSTDQVPEGGK